MADINWQQPDPWVQAGQQSGAILHNNIMRMFQRQEDYQRHQEFLQSLGLQQQRFGLDQQRFQLEKQAAPIENKYRQALTGATEAQGEETKQRTSHEKKIDELGDLVKELHMMSSVIKQKPAEFANLYHAITNALGRASLPVGEVTPDNAPVMMKAAEEGILSGRAQESPAEAGRLMLDPEKEQMRMLLQNRLLGFRGEAEQANRDSREKVAKMGTESREKIANKNDSAKLIHENNTLRTALARIAAANSQRMTTGRAGAANQQAAGILGVDTPQPQQAAPTSGVPPVAQRVIGQVYTLPSGRFMWTTENGKTGWKKVE